MHVVRSKVSSWIPCLAVAFFIGCGGAAPDASPSAEAPEVSESSSGDEAFLSGVRAAPDDVFPTLDGEQATLADLQGTVTVVNFWGVWCLPCRHELPELVELAEAYADEPVTMLGIAVESGTPEEIQAFLADYGVEYPIWMTGMDVAIASFGAVGFPFTILIDKEGWVRKELLGPQTADQLAAEIDALLQ